MKIIKKILPDSQYFKETTTKKMIVLHHTVSGKGVEGDIKWWAQTPERVGTHYIISREGEVTQVLEDKYWIHHLGVTLRQLSLHKSTVSNERLNQLSIGIELDNWGGLVKRSGKWYSYTGVEIPACDVQEYPKGYRGYYAFEKYPAAQLLALRELIEVICKNNPTIPKKYFPEMWDFNSKAVRGYHGIWSHTSFRPDKSDCHPQPELNTMLKNLSGT